MLVWEIEVEALQLPLPGVTHSIAELAEQGNSGIDKWRIPVFLRGQVRHVSTLKSNTFDWGKLGQFYLTMVAPYVLTYAGLYIVDLFVPDLLGAFLDTALVVAAFGAITTNLLSSISGHLVTLGLRQAQ